MPPFQESRQPGTGLREYQLGPEAIGYVRECLGWQTLSTLLLRSLDLGSGRILTCLPDGMDSERLADFEHGGKMPSGRVFRNSADGSIAVEIIDTTPWLAARVSSCLARAAGRVLIIEDYLSTRGDPRLADGPPVMFRDEEVYAVLAGRSVTADEAERAIRSASAMPSFAGLVADGWDNLQVADHQLSEEHLSRLAARAVLLFVMAYDGESYLVWSKD